MTHEKDLEFLKDEYRNVSKTYFSCHCSKIDASFYLGKKNGLEIALLRLGVLNDELDQITTEAHRIAEQEQESRDCGGDY